MRLIRVVVVAGLVAPPIQALLLRWVNPPLTWTMVGSAWRHGRATGDWRLPDHQWVDIDDLPRHVPSAVLSSEDRGFFQHNGFEWHAIRSAWRRYRTRPGAKLVGGSTLSQQVARNAFLTQHRSWVRKGLEAWYTVWLELFVPKERILEVYLNIAEMGPMTFGVESASQLWFRHPAKRLRHAEAATLAAMLPSPNRWTPQTPHVKRRAAWILAAPVSMRR